MKHEGLLSTFREAAAGLFRPLVASREGLRWLLLYSTANAMGCAIITFAAIPHEQLLGSPFASAAFLVAAALGHFFFCTLALAVPVWVAYCISRSPRVLICSAVLVHALWILILLADGRVFALYRFHLNGMVLNMLLGGALSEQVVLSRQMWAMSAAVALLVVAAEIALAHALWRWFRPSRIRVARYVVAAMLSLMFVSQALAAYHDAKADYAKMRLLAYIPWAQLLTMKGRLHRLGIAVEDGVKPPSSDGGTLHYPVRPLQCSAPVRRSSSPGPRGPDLNVLIVLVESLRADMLTQDAMPNTWALAQKATRYANHYSTGNATRFGLFGLMYGLPGGYWQTMLAEQRGPVLIDTLQQAGYAMHIYGSAPLYSPEFDRTAFSQVRDRIVNAPKGPGAGRDRYVIDRMRKDIRDQPKDKRFFGFVFLDSTHAPYHLPEGFVSPYAPYAAGVNFFDLGPQEDPTPIFNRYRSAVRYADQLIGELLETLKASPVAENTVVVVAGDHGEEFNDLGLNYWGHNGNFSEFQTHTPFVVYWPGRMPKVVDGTSSHQDLAPTLMKHVLGCRNGIGDYSTGLDLLGDLPAQRDLLVESWSRRGIRRGERTYLFESFGPAEVLGRDYKPVPGATADPKVIAHAWEELTRFKAGASKE